MVVKNTSHAGKQSSCAANRERLHEWPKRRTRNRSTGWRQKRVAGDRISLSVPTPGDGSRGYALLRHPVGSVPRTGVWPFVKRSRFAAHLTASAWDVF